MTYWDIYLAEYADTRRSEARPVRPCVYCGTPTKSAYRVCRCHDDLPDLDPQGPALDKAGDTSPGMPRTSLSADHLSPVGAVSPAVSSAAASTDYGGSTTVPVVIAPGTEPPRSFHKPRPARLSGQERTRGPQHEGA